MIDKFHSKNATVLELNPATVKTRILGKKRYNAQYIIKVRGILQIYFQNVLSHIFGWGLTNVNGLAHGKTEQPRRLERSIYKLHISPRVVMFFFS